MNRLKEHREARGLTQQEVASRLGLSQGAIAHYEKCRRHPDLPKCRAFVDLFSQIGPVCTLEQVFPPDSKRAADPSTEAA